MTQPSTIHAGTEPTVRLRHGTTSLRAAHLLQHGPDPLGAPEDYARGKARLFPREGGPAILEIDVSESIVARAVHPGGEVWFGPGFGLGELLAAWPQIAKRVVTP